jgi:hypothetical protein
LSKTGWILSLGAGVALLLLSKKGASAAPGVPKLTVTPASPIPLGASYTISLSGFTPNSDVSTTIAAVGTAPFNSTVHTDANGNYSETAVADTAGTFVATASLGSLTAQVTWTVSSGPPPAAPVLIYGGDNGLTVIAGSWSVQSDGIHLTWTVKNMNPTSLTSVPNGELRVWFNPSVSGANFASLGGIDWDNVGTWPSFGNSQSYSVVISQALINQFNAVPISSITSLAIEVQLTGISGLNSGIYEL